LQANALGFESPLSVQAGFLRNTEGSLFFLCLGVNHIKKTYKLNLLVSKKRENARKCEKNEV